MNYIEVVTKFQPQSVDKIFIEESVTAILESGNKFIDVNFNETGYVKIAEILVDGLGNYRNVNESALTGPEYAHYAGQNGEGARDGMPRGNASLKWKIYELQWQRAKEFLVDQITDEKAAGTLLANLLNEFNRTRVVPEADICRFGEMAKKCSASLGNFVSEAISANAIIGKFNKAFEWMKEHGVPEDEQVIYVNPAVMTLIQETTELNKFLTQADFRNGNGITFALKAYMDRPIISVPSDRFYTDVVLTQNGYQASATSKVINFMIVSKKAVLPLRKLEYSKVFKPGEVPGFYGYVLDYLLYHGIIIPKNKVPGIYTSVSSTTTGASVSGKLDVLLTAGAVTADSMKMTEFYTTPAGLNGRVAFQSSATEITAALAKVGDTITLGDTWKLLPEDSEVVVSNDHIQCVLIGTEGKALAVTGDIDVSDIKHA